jgi:hypothetical protein
LLMKDGIWRVLLRVMDLDTKAAGKTAEKISGAIENGGVGEDNRLAEPS